jgi:glycerol kinase
VGLWNGCDGVAALPRQIDRFVPRLDAEGRATLLRGWRRALRQALMVA